MTFFFSGLEPAFRVREPSKVHVAAFKERVEKHAVQTSPPCESLISRSQKSKAERRINLQFGKKTVSKESLGPRHGHQDQRSPTSSQEPFQSRLAVSQRIQLIGYLRAEREKLLYEAIQRRSIFHGSRKQRSRTVLQIFLYILQIVTELKKHSPVECETRFRICESSVRKAGVCQHRGAALRAAQTQN